MSEKKQELKTIQDDDEVLNSYIKGLIAAIQQGEDVIKYQLNAREIILDIILNVGGFFRDPEKETLIRRKDANINSTGVLRVAEILNFYLNRNTFLSTLSKGEICRTMIALVINLDIEFMNKKNMGKYGIDEDRIDLTLEGIEDDIFFALKRAYEGNTMKSIQEYLKVSEMLKAAKDEKKDKSIFDE
jgi:hypothetical protein